MEIEQFLDEFADELDETKRNDISEMTMFKRLEEWSSLTALSIIAMIDENYDVSVTGADMRKAETILDLFNIVKSRKDA